MRAVFESLQWYLTWGVPNPQSLLPDDLRSSGYNNNRSQVRNKCNVFESSWNHSPSPSMEIMSSTNLVRGAKKIGAAALGSSLDWGECDSWCQNYLWASFAFPRTATVARLIKVIVVQSPSRVWLFVTPWTAARQASLSLTISWSSPKFMSIALVMPSSHLILWCPLLLLLSIFHSNLVFSNESALDIRWPKYRSFNFSISSSNKYSGLISLEVDWFDLLAVHGTLRSLFQHHSSKASILWCSALFVVPLSQPYMTAGETLPWLYGLLSAEYCLCFSARCLGLSELSCQEANVFWFHGCSHHLQWF